MYISPAALCCNRNLVCTRNRKSVKERLSNYFETYTPASANTGSCKLKSVDIDFEGRKLSIYASESFAYQPFVPETVDEIYHQIEELLPGPVRFFPNYNLCQQPTYRGVDSQFLSREEEKR